MFEIEPVELKGFDGYIENTPTYKKYGFQGGNNKHGGTIMYNNEIYNIEILYVMGEVNAYCRHLNTGSFGSTHGFDKEKTIQKEICCFLAQKFAQKVIREAEQKYKEDFKQ